MRYPFFPNSKNQPRCVQAVMRMVLAAEGMRFTLARLDRLTGRKNGEVTWDAPVQLAMHRFGFDCLLYEDFDFQKFAKNGMHYLRRAFGKPWADEEARYTDIVRQQEFAKIMTATMHSTLHPKATLSTVQRLFHERWHCAPTMNLAVLRGQKGFTNHCVLVVDMDETTVIMHDPGLPPRKAWRVSVATFRKAFTGTLKAWQRTAPRSKQ